MPAEPCAWRGGLRPSQGSLWGLRAAAAAAEKGSFLAKGSGLWGVGDGSDSGDLESKRRGDPTRRGLVSLRHRWQGGGHYKRAAAPLSHPLYCISDLQSGRLLFLQRPLFRGKCLEDLEDAVRAPEADILLMDI